MSYHIEEHAEWIEYEPTRFEQFMFDWGYSLASVIIFLGMIALAAWYTQTV